jgi:hypothetical protein
VSGQTGLSYASAMAAAGVGVTVTRPGATVRVRDGLFVRVQPGFPKYLSTPDDREATDWSTISNTGTD